MKNQKKPLLFVTLVTIRGFRKPQKLSLINMDRDTYCGLVRDYP